jgi:hypothetical protein
MTCADFWCAPLKDQIEFYMRKAHQQGQIEAIHLFTTGQISPEVFFQMAYDGGEAGRLMLHLDYCKANNLKGVVLDLSQNLHMNRPNASSAMHMPTLCKNSVPWRDRHMLPEERMLVLGILALPHFVVPGASKPMLDVSCLRPSEMNMAAGNGMLVEVVTAVAMWGLVSMSLLELQIFQMPPEDSDCDDMKF